MHLERRSNNRIRHILTAVFSAGLLLGLPLFWYFGPTGRKADVISSPTVIIEQPSGAYVVWINPERHTDPEKLDTWMRFFAGEEIGFLFEDISCFVIRQDTEGCELAESFQSRLPENQMRLAAEDATLLLSKAWNGTYDVILFSREAYEAYHAEEYRQEKHVCEVVAEGSVR